MENNSFKMYRNRSGLSQKEVAVALNITQGAISAWESGRNRPDIAMLSKLANLYKVSVDDLLGNNDIDSPARPIEVKPEIVAEDEVLIPVIATLRCGFNYIGEPYTVLRRVPVPKSYIAKWGKNIVGIEAAGNSMLPTIKPKDLLIVIPGEWFENNNIVVVDINDSDTVKRIRKNNDGSIDLIPDNEEYEPMHLTPEELEMYQVHILGRVAKVIGPDLL